MDRYSGHKSAGAQLYSTIDPFDQQILHVNGGHQIYFEQCGRTDGIPVVVLHGGPGGGCSPSMRRYFDPNIYRVILFDQRGCGRSRPYAGVENNTTQDLISDIEAIRTHLGIDQWIVFGGSWGATLALLYAQAFKNAVSHLVLRGVFLMTRSELDWFYGGGAGKFWPEQWEKFTDPIPKHERQDLIAAYNKRLFCGNVSVETKYGQSWSNWENALASFQTNGRTASMPGPYARAFARIENHYFLNDGFLKDTNEILENMETIKSIPGFIVQGRFDMICPPKSAWDLAECWENCDLRIVDHAGHAMSEPAISSELVRIMDLIAETIRD